MGVKQIQANFSFGELDPKLLCRPDFTGYYKGARKLRNVICIPQGGVKRRFGTKYAFVVVDTGNANTPVTNRDEIKSLIFDFSKEKPFLIVVRPHNRLISPRIAFDIYLFDVLQATVTTNAYTIAQIKDLNFVKAQDRIIILHPNVPPNELVRGVNDATWTVDQILFAYKPTYDFSIIDGPQNYRDPFPAFWTVSATSGNITITASPIAMFDAGHVGGLIFGGGGVARILTVTSAYTATARVVQDFDSTGTFYGNDTVLQSVAWGDFTGGTPPGKYRGYPSLGAFFQNRLILANSPSLPNVVWASNVYDFYNFNTENADALDAFTVGIGSNGNEEVQDIVATKALVVLGFSGFYSSSLFIDVPMTPANAFLNEQSRDGASALDAQIIDNQIFYIDENEEQVRSATYDIGTSSFNIFDASLLSPQVISDPVATAALRPKNDDGSFYMVVNRDGTLAIFQSLQDQSVNAWTLSETRGSIYQVPTARDTAYMAVRRCITTGSTITGLADNIYTANSNFQAITDITTPAEDPGSDVTLFTNAGEYLVIGHECPFYNVAFTFDTTANDSIQPTFQYLNKFDQWVNFTATDLTIGCTQNGTISWSLNALVDWAPVDISDNPSVHVPPASVHGIQTKFWIRIQRNNPVLFTPPIENTIFINVENRIYFESIDFDEAMDCSFLTQSDGAGLVTGLNHLIGQQVYVLANTIPEGPYFVSASGTVVLRNPSTATGSVEVGINFIPEIIPMPLAITEQTGINLFQQKFIKTIYIYYYNSLGVLVNGEELATLQVGSLVLDQIPIPVTGFQQLAPRRGWDPTEENVISQELPLPFTIIGIGYIVET